MKKIHMVIQIRDKDEDKYYALHVSLGEDENVWRYLQSLNSTRQEVVSANVYPKNKCIALAVLWNKGFNAQGKLWW